MRIDDENDGACMRVVTCARLTTGVLVDESGPVFYENDDALERDFERLTTRNIEAAMRRMYALSTSSSVWAETFDELEERVRVWQAASVGCLGAYHDQVEAWISVMNALMQRVRIEIERLRDVSIEEDHHNELGSAVTELVEFYDAQRELWAKLPLILGSAFWMKRYSTRRN